MTLQRDSKHDEERNEGHHESGGAHLGSYLAGNFVLSENRIGVTSWRQRYTRKITGKRNEKRNRKLTRSELIPNLPVKSEYCDVKKEPKNIQPTTSKRGGRQRDSMWSGTPTRLQRNRKPNEKTVSSGHRRKKTHTFGLSNGLSRAQEKSVSKYEEKRHRDQCIRDENTSCRQAKGTPKTTPPQVRNESLSGSLQGGRTEKGIGSNSSEPRVVALWECLEVHQVHENLRVITDNNIYTYIYMYAWRRIYIYVYIYIYI